MKFSQLLNIWFQLRGKHWWFSILLCSTLVAPAQASILLRVAIEQDLNQVTIGSSTKAVVKNSAGRTLGQITPMKAFSAQPNADGVAIAQMHSSALSIEPTGNGYVFISDRWYRGKTFLFPTPKGLTAVNYVDLEQYLYSVLGSEMSSNWPLEALKAQAVAARTYAVYKRQNERNGVYDVGDTTASQVYKGLESESSRTQAAVKATAGQVMTYKDNVILSVFHACSGGHTENVEDVWSQKLPYLRGVQDFDQNVSACQWAKTFSGEELSQRLTGVGNVLSLTPTFTAYGSLKTMKVFGDRGTRELKGEDVRNLLQLRSTRFIMKEDPLGLRLDGRGWGHGLGMSQWGAFNMAKQGADYQQILGHYYRGTNLAKIN